MNDDLWDRVRGLGSETWKVCERVENVLGGQCACTGCECQERRLAICSTKTQTIRRFSEFPSLFQSVLISKSFPCFEVPVNRKLFTVNTFKQEKCFISFHFDSIKEDSPWARADLQGTPT